MNTAPRILLALSLALSPLACTATIVSGGTGGGSTTTTSGDPENPTGGNPTNPTGGNPTPVEPPEPVPTTAVAYSGAALDACINQTNSSGSSTSSSSGGVDAGTLFLTVGSPVSCTCPYDSGDCGTWEVTIGLPAESQQAGTVVELDANANSTFGESSPPEDSPDSCEGGGGSFVGGTLTVVSIDDSQVTFTLSGTMQLDFGIGSADGTYTATRCP